MIIGVDPHKSSHTATAVDPATNTPERFTVYIKSEIPEFAKIVKTAGITPA